MSLRQNPLYSQRFEQGQFLTPFVYVLFPLGPFKVCDA